MIYQTMLYILGGALFLLVMGWVGQSDLEQAILSEKLYCERVFNGVHSHYQNRIDCTQYN
jgi:hypothetical protein